MSEGPSNGVQRRLTLFDATCLMVGIILGAGIYEMTPTIAAGAGSWWMLLLFLVAGAFLSLCGGLIYAELGSTYPREGGDYVYLSQAYGRWSGFLFGWTITTVARPGDIAAMAFIFATYAMQIWDPTGGWSYTWASFSFAGQPHECVFNMGSIYAVAAVLAFTSMNVVGVQSGKWTQNILTVVKVLGLIIIICAALAAPAVDRGDVTAPAGEIAGPPASVAFLLVLFVYGGWVETAYVAAEIRNPRRNLLRAALVGLGTIAVLYVALNVAFLHLLGFEGVATSSAVAADAMNVVVPHWGGRFVSVLICLSALGAVNGLIFAGSRVSYALGHDNRFFRFLGKWDEQRGVPIRALAVQGAIATVLVLVLGSTVNAVLYTSPVLYVFIFLTCMATHVLRDKQPNADRPYRTTGYPFTPFILGVTVLFLVHGTVTYRPLMTGIAFGIVLLGLPVYLLQKLTDRADNPPNNA